MFCMMRIMFIVVIAILSGDILAEEPAAFSPGDIDFFEKRVRPLLVQRCYECHASTSQKLRGGLMLDSRDGVLKGGDTGPAAEPGQPTKSLLIEAIRYDSEQIQMPPAGKLPDTEIAILLEWVQRGLPFPKSAAATNSRHAVDVSAGREHWAFRPLKSGNLHGLPPDPWSTWSRTGIDAFVLAKQLERQMQPAPVAPRQDLIRRLKFDLLGLPPTREEIESFVQDSAPNAYERLVDRYLASPQYGERWARYWLDLARYCDVPESWREGEARAWLYRDWVVGALNEDLGYDQFVRHQFAADLLPNAVPTDNSALGFLGLSPTYWKELKLDHLVIKQVVAEEWEERIEAIGATFLGLTLACARCHDHKFDPITMRDYYGLAGVLASIKLDDQSILPPEPAAKARQSRARIKELQKQIDPLLAKKPISEENQAKVDELKKQIEQIRKETPELDVPEVFGVMEASLQVLPDGAARTKLEYRSDQPQDVALQIRGNASKPGPIVPRGFPAVLSDENGKRFQHGSGRLELADAIVTDAAPLAARVFVNRVWKHHFGRGIVSTLSNFGIQGEAPSHPDLLDDLAARFISHRWSVKWLHREILLSAAYQQTSAVDPTLDPDNVWLARMPLRRLDVEAWRDAMLCATDELDLRIGGPSQDLLEANNRRRTLYGTVKRRELADILRLHDFPDPVAHVASREPTTTPLQQLFVLNSPLMRERSSALVRRLPPASPDGTAERIRQMYSFVFSREVAAHEVAPLLEFLSAAQGDGVSEEEAWTQLAQVLLGSNELLFVE
jgi:hypothetical protein